MAKKPMKLWAVTMCLDEEDVIDHTLYHLAKEGVDGIIVSDNLSADSTRDKIYEAKKNIEANYSTKVHFKLDSEVAYKQDYKMTMMAREAGRMGADWVIPFDADELWYSTEGTLKDTLTIYDAAGTITAKPLYTNHSVTYLDDMSLDNPYERMVYRWAEPTNYKTCFKFRPDISISNGNHFVYWHEGGVHTRDENPLFDVIQIRHFQWRSEAHFVNKVLNAYRACKALPENADLRGGAAWKEHFLVYEKDGIDGLKNMFHREVYVTDVSNGVLDPAPYRGDI